MRGSGPGGRIQRHDVEGAQRAAAQARGPAPSALPAPVPAPAPIPAALPPPSPAAARSTYRDAPVTGLRKVIAERMAQSFHGSVPVLLTSEAIMDRADDLLATVGAELAERSGGKVGYLPLVLEAAAFALRKHPALNAHWLGSAIRLFDDVDIGVAVARDDGLVVPVVRQVDRMRLGDLSAAVSALADRARRNALTVAEMEGGTFTVSNLGRYSVGHFMPVINPPQVAILGVGRASARPVARDGRVEVLPVLPLSLVFDHRAVDGAPAAALLDTIVSVLEEPRRLLL